MLWNAASCSDWLQKDYACGKERCGLLPDALHGQHWADKAAECCCCANCLSILHDLLFWCHACAAHFKASGLWVALTGLFHANTLHWGIQYAFGLVQTGGPIAPDVGESTRRRHSLLLTKSPTLWDDRPPGRGYSRCLAKCIVQ